MSCDVLNMKLRHEKSVQTETEFVSILDDANTTSHAIYTQISNHGQKWDMTSHIKEKKCPHFMRKPLKYDFKKTSQAITFSSFSRNSFFKGRKHILENWA